MILDHESTIRYANPAVADVFGYRPEEMMLLALRRERPEPPRELRSAFTNREIQGISRRFSAWLGLFAE